MLVDMHYYNSDAFRGTMADVYSQAFRVVFKDAFAGNGKCVTCDSLKRYEKQLKRFKLDCDMGLVHVSIRKAFLEECWAVPVAEGFLEYLSRQTTVSLMEYGIDVSCIISHVAKIAVSSDSAIVKFLPEAIFTEDWLLYVIPYAPSVVDHIDVDERILLRLVEENPDDPFLINEHNITRDIALAYLRLDIENICHVPVDIRLEACEAFCRELWAENAELKKHMKI